MSIINIISLIINGITVPLSLGFLLVILWTNRQRTENQFLSLFLLMVIIWNSGSLLAVVISTIDPTAVLLRPVIGLLEYGLIGTSITIYAFTGVLIGAISLRFRILLILGLVIMFVYQLLVTQLSGNSIPDFSSYRFQNIFLGFYVLFMLTTCYLLWRYRARVTSGTLRTGILGFILGQSLGFLNPDLGVFSLSVALSSIFVLIMMLAIFNFQIVTPLSERISQIEAMHNMGLAITSQIDVNIVLKQIVKQAKDWLNIDGVGIFLKSGESIELVAVDGLPDQFLNLKLPLSNGVAGEVIQNQESIAVEDYERDWKKVPDLPLAGKTFGSVACVPLIYGGDTIGALMVIAGKHNKTIQKEDVHLLELLGAQAAVAITNGQLFAMQHLLTEEIEDARNQLETVLTSTENPVIAVSRKLEVIFANSAAERLFPNIKYISRPIIETLPSFVLPSSYRKVIEDVTHGKVHTYEISHDSRVYFSQVAPLGHGKRIEGWVAVLNDVTQLKELDRLKSEMIRMTSHDLKNPLQAAMANLDLLRDSIEENDTEESKYTLEVIEKQFERMYRIISNVLDLERVRTGSRKIQLCQPEEILSVVVGDMSPLAHDNAIDLIVNDIPKNLPPFQGDARQFEQAITNLVENAIKFTPQGGKVTVNLYLKQNQIIFSIKDTGIGIEPQYHEKIFDSFFRVNQKGSEHISGTGLGLNLVKTVVQNHGGQIWLESEKDKGTTFFVSIPAITDGMMSISSI